VVALYRLPTLSPYFLAFAFQFGPQDRQLAMISLRIRNR
jgi:hypothetical protein